MWLEGCKASSALSRCLPACLSVCSEPWSCAFGMLLYSWQRRILHKSGQYWAILTELCKPSILGAIGTRPLARNLRLGAGDGTRLGQMPQHSLAAALVPSQFSEAHLATGEMQQDAWALILTASTDPNCCKAHMHLSNGATSFHQGTSRYRDSTRSH
ncbi:hypothetical protein B0T22DRAFT_280075 [Podospora appendiculata]|uniref:Uncharacterized protein n=1 Tax=Podospora appendiculata TaxID=314037 RepID=A0AAE0X0E4_9PEZI|nr:hypothetical protein B0T22DRAFT_280075 [Podospora appendiculata]